MLMKIEDTLECVIDNRGKTPPIADEGNCLLEINCIANKGKFPDYGAVKKHVTEETYSTWFRAGHPKKGDILIPTVGTLDAIGYMDRDDCCIAQNLIAFRTKKDVCNSEYLFYLLCNPIIRMRLLNLNIGGVQPSIKVPHLKKLEVEIPPLDIQEKIVAILHALDEKIAVNEQINRNLLEQTEALFKSWFEDFEPWNGIMPENWKQGVLGDFVTIKRGGSPRPIQEFLSDDGLRWLKISDVSGLQSPYILDIAEHIIEAGLKKTVHLGEGALVLSNSATPGIPKILDVDSCIHDGWLYFPESQLSNYFLFLFFKSIRSNLVALGNGSVFTNLKTDILKNYSFSKPDIDTLNQFDELVTPMFVAMREVARENHYLSELRDSLLPKLMSGELDISDLDI